jgi:hypothetical protein
MEEVIFEISRWELHIKSLSLPKPMRVLIVEEIWGRLHDYRWGILLSPLGGYTNMNCPFTLSPFFPQPSHLQMTAETGAKYSSKNRNVQSLPIQARAVRHQWKKKYGRGHVMMEWGSVFLLLGEIPI